MRRCGDKSKANVVPDHSLLCTANQEQEWNVPGTVLQLLELDNEYDWQGRVGMEETLACPMVPDDKNPDTKGNGTTKNDWIHPEYRLFNISTFRVDNSVTIHRP